MQISKDDDWEFGNQTLVGYGYRNCGWRLEIRNLELCMRYGDCEWRLNIRGRA